MQLFIWSSHDDYLAFKSFTSHMASIKHAYTIDIWADQRIQAGYGWSKLIEDAINSSNIFVLLASPGFLRVYVHI